MTTLVTGAAGFIGFHLCKKLLKNGEKVVGIDNFNEYHDPSLKHARISLLKDLTSENPDLFKIYKVNIEDAEKVNAIFLECSPIKSSILRLGWSTVFDTKSRSIHSIKSCRFL